MADFLEKLERFNSALKEYRKSGRHKNPTVSLAWHNELVTRTNILIDNLPDFENLKIQLDSSLTNEKNYLVLVKIIITIVTLAVIFYTV